MSDQAAWTTSSGVKVFTSNAGETLAQRWFAGERSRALAQTEHRLCAAVGATPELSGLAHVPQIVASGDASITVTLPGAGLPPRADVDHPTVADAVRLLCYHHTEGRRARSFLPFIPSKQPSIWAFLSKIRRPSTAMERAIRSTTAWDTAHRDGLRQLAWSSSVGLLHGNAHWGNLLAHADACPTWVDWGCSGFGDPAWDLAAMAATAPMPSSQAQPGPHIRGLAQALARHYVVAAHACGPADARGRQVAPSEELDDLLARLVLYLPDALVLEALRQARASRAMGEEVQRLLWSANQLAPMVVASE